MLFKCKPLLCPQALIPLALEGTDAGKVKACHALAKIAAISNPEIAFPGERVRHASVTYYLFCSSFAELSMYLCCSGVYLILVKQRTS